MKYDYAIERLKDLNEGKEMEFMNGSTREWALDRSPELSRLNMMNDPTRYRTKPAPRKVPWGLEDIRSDMWFKNPNDCSEYEGFKIDWCNHVNVRIDGRTMSYEDLQKDYVYRVDGSLTYLPCEKDEVTK